MASAPPSRCSNCAEPLQNPMVCGSCRTVFPATGEYDHFARFGIPRRFAIDLEDLERRYLVLSRGLHPDQFALRSKEEREIAERLSAHVNDAFHVLREPLRRAEYLLELEGGPMRAQEKRTPPGFLAETLELNERIAEPGTDLEELRKDLLARLDSELENSAPLFASLPPKESPARAAALVAIRERLNACAYLHGLVTKIGELLLR